MAVVRGGAPRRRPRQSADPHRAIVARAPRMGALGAPRADPAAGAAPQHPGAGRGSRPRRPRPRDDAGVARGHLRVPGTPAVRVGPGPAARPPRLRHRLRLPGPLRVRGPDPDRPPRLARPRRAPPRSPLGLGRRAHDDAGLLPLRVHAGAARRSPSRRRSSSRPLAASGAREPRSCSASRCPWRGPRSPPGPCWPAWRRSPISGPSRRSASAR